MGNRQSVTITHPKADGKQVKIDEVNGHAMSGLDLTDVVTCEASVQQNTEPPPVTVTLNVKPTPASTEANGTKAKAPTVSVEAAGNQVSAEFSTPAIDTPKQAKSPNMFNKMFKKKSGLIFPPSEDNIAAEVPIVPAVETSSKNSNPTAVSVEADGIQAKAPAVSVEAAGIQVSATTSVSAESSTPAKDTPKQEETPSMFNKMFKKKTVAAEVPIVLAVETSSQNSNPTAASVEAKAPAVSVEAAGIQVNATTSVSADSITPAKDTPKQVETPSVFNKMFKKKTGLVFPPSEVNVAAEVPVVLAVETMNQNSNPAAASVEADGIQAKALDVSVEAAAIQVNATTSVSTESSTPAKDTPKQVETPSVFNKMFKKKTVLVFPPAEASVATEVPIVPAVEKTSQNSNPTAVSVEANGIQAKAPAVSLEAAGIQVSATTSVSESSTPAKDTPKQVETPSMFNKMFKKKTVVVSPASEANIAAEVPIVLAVETANQNSNPTAVSVEAKAPAVSVEAGGIQVNATTSVSADSSTPAKDTPKQVETPSVFNKMFKKKTGLVFPPSEVNVAAEVPVVLAVETSSQNSDTDTQDIEEGDDVALQLLPDLDYEIMEAAENLTLQLVSSTQSAASSQDTQNTSDNNTESVEGEELKNEEESEEESWVLIEDPVCADDSEDFAQLLCQLKSVCIKTVEHSSYSLASVNVHTKRRSIQITINICSSMDNQTKTTKEEQFDTDIPGNDNVWSSEPTDIKTSTQADKEPQGEASTEVSQDSTQTEQTSTEEKTVMNFFKTLVTSTKTKEATASPDVSKEQSQKESPPAPAANVQEALKVPPPPPPAPPKMESKAEPAVKKEEAPPVQVAAAAAKQPDTPGKAKTKDSPFSKLFRSKSGVKEEAKPIEIQVDASKTSTLEISAKTEPTPAPKPEDKKAEKKPSPFANLLKPKVLLGQVSSKIHAAASSAASSISLGAGGGATEPKKEAPAAVTAPAEAAPSTKAKEEPKPAAAPPPPAASADNKSVGSTDNSSPSTSRKLEKRNSIQLFFKNLGQKRHSDAGVQTEPVAAEKAK